MRSTPLAAVSLAALALVAGCTRDDQVATATPAPTAAPALTRPTTAAPTTAVPPPTVAPPTTAPPVSAAPTSVVSTRAPDTTAAATPTTAVATTPAPTAPPTTAAPAPVDAVVTVHYGWSPIGVWDGAAWSYPQWSDDGAPRAVAEIPSVVAVGLDLGAPVTGGTFGPLDYFCVGDELAPRVDMPGDLGEAAYVAVSAVWNVQPRPVSQVGLDAPEYQILGETLVAGRPGADATAGDVTQAVRADLDGNGVEEVLFTFEHQTDDGGFGALGDYTLIVARYPAADGTVVDHVLWEFFEEDPVELPNPGTGELLAVADLNGDGVMEVVTAHQYWEAGTATIYTLVDGRLTEVAGGGCGV